MTSDTAPADQYTVTDDDLAFCEMIDNTPTPTDALRTAIDAALATFSPANNVASTDVCDRLLDMRLLVNAADEWLRNAISLWAATRTTHPSADTPATDGAA